MAELDVAAVDPNIVEEKDDFSTDLSSNREAMGADAAITRLRQKYGSEPKPVEAVPGEAPPVDPASDQNQLTEGNNAGNTGKSIFVGQVLGGARDAGQAALNLADEVGDWVRDKVPDFLGGGLVGDEEGIRILGREAYDQWKEKNQVKKDVPELPNPDIIKPNPESTTAGIVRGVSQFLTGWVVGGAALKGVKAVGGVAQAAKAATQGAIADFTAFEGHEKNLSNLIQEHPALQNPVSEFLASSPNDSDIEGRTKRTVEGLGVGVAVDGFMTALKAMRVARVGQAQQRSAARAAGETVPMPPVKADDFRAIGNPEEGLFVKRKLQEGAEATKGIGPEGVSGAVPKGEEVSINFARIDTPEDIKKIMGKMASEAKKPIDEARRGVRTWEMTKLSADQEDAWKTLMNRRQGTGLNAEESVAARQLWATSATKLKDVAKIAKDVPTEANLFSFRKMLATHYAIQKEVIAARTETARALNAWKIPAGSSQRGMMQQLESLLQGSGGTELARDMADRVAKLADAGTAYELEKFVEGGWVATTKNTVQQVWINALLSNPSTHVVNALSNWTVAGQQIYERRTAEFLSQKLGTEGGVEVGEAAAMANGMISSFKDAMVASLKSLKTGASEALTFGTKIEVPSGKTLFSPETYNMGTDTMIGRALDVVDNGTRLPGRLLGASDEFFKTIGYRMELHAQALRQASKEVGENAISPKDLKKRIAEIIENPPENVKIDSVDAALYNTFQNRPAETLKKIGDAIQNVPVLGRLLLPFKNTPINIMTYAFERTPMAPLVQRWRADVMAGGARSDIALSRMATGSMIMASAMDMAMSGVITGKGPRERGQRQNWTRQGNQEYSIKIGDKWYSFSRLDPIGMTLGMAADLGEAVMNADKEIPEEEFEKAMVASAFAMSNNVLSKTYMKGISEFFQAVSNPEQYGQSYFKRLAGSLVPAGVAAVTRHGIPGVVESDSYMRSADNVIDALRRRVPGLSEDLPLYRDLWGRTVDYRSGEGWAQDMFSPIYIKKNSSEPADKELQRLGYYPDMPERKLSFQGIAVELTPKQYERYVELQGNEHKHPAWRMGLKDFLNAVVEKKHPMSPVYNMWGERGDGPDGFRATFIKNWINQYRDQAKRKLFEEDKSLQAAVTVARKSSNKIGVRLMEGR
jgi:hypothetical protein